MIFLFMYLKSLAYVGLGLVVLVVLLIALFTVLLVAVFFTLMILFLLGGMGLLVYKITEGV